MQCVWLLFHNDNEDMLQNHVSVNTQTQYHRAWRLHTHRSERWYCSWTPMQASLLSVPCTIYPAGRLLPQTPDQCGTLWNDLSCRKATTPPQIASQRTVSATRRCLWPKDKPMWGPFCARVCVCVCASRLCLISGLFCHEEGREVCGLWPLEKVLVYFHVCVKEFKL